MDKLNYINTINIKGLGKNIKPLLYALNKDGDLNLIIINAVCNKDNINYNKICGITSYDLNGNVIWKFGEENYDNKNIIGDIPVQVVDIDNDRVYEIIFIIEDKIIWLNGLTGEIKKEHYIPEKINFESIIVGNISGNNKKDIILKDVDSGLWAFDNNMNLLWKYKNNTNYHPRVYDLDGDGKDEILVGNTILNSDGTIRLHLKENLEDINCICIGDITYDPASGVELLINSSKGSLGMYTWEGDEIFYKDSKENIKSVEIGKFDNKIDGIQIATIESDLNKLNNMNNYPKVLNKKLCILDKNGIKLREKELNYDDDEIRIKCISGDIHSEDYILIYSAEGKIKPIIYNGRLEVVEEIPSNSKVEYIRLLNYFNQFLVTYDESDLVIYSNKNTHYNSKYKFSTNNKFYNTTVYQGSDLVNRQYSYHKSMHEVEISKNNVKYDFNLEKGVYDISIIFGSDESESIVDKVSFGWRRVAFKNISTRIGEFIEKTFTVKILDENLYISISGKNPIIDSIKVKKSDCTAIFLVGDSTVCDHYEEPYMGWGQVLPYFFNKGVSIINKAFCGRSTVSFMGEGRLDYVLSNVNAGDYVFIQFGHNDQKKGAFHAESEGKYKLNLKLYIDEIRKRNANPVLVTPMPRRKFNENGKIINTLEDYPDIVRLVSKEEDVPLIDLNKKVEELINKFGVEESKKIFVHIKKGLYGEYSDGIIDNTHFSEYGAFEIAKKVIEEIKLNQLDVCKYVRN